MEKLTIQQREQEFRQVVAAFSPQYEPAMLDEFCDYWTEPNRSKTKMKVEMQKTWDTARRLKTWFRNNTNWNKNGQSNSKSATATIFNLRKVGNF